MRREPEGDPTLDARILSREKDCSRVSNDREGARAARREQHWDESILAEDSLLNVAS